MEIIVFIVVLIFSNMVTAIVTALITMECVEPKEKSLYVQYLESKLFPNGRKG